MFEFNIYLLPRAGEGSVDDMVGIQYNAFCSWVSEDACSFGLGLVFSFL
jgi:hypothetical protein